MDELGLNYGAAKRFIGDLDDVIESMREEKAQIERLKRELNDFDYNHGESRIIDDLNEDLRELKRNIEKLEDFRFEFSKFVQEVKDTDEYLSQKIKGDIAEYNKANNIKNISGIEKLIEKIQVGLDIIGLIPGIGEIADFVNGAISLLQGHYGEALLCFAAMIPIAGDSLKGLKYADEAGLLLKKGAEALGTGKKVLQNGAEKTIKLAKNAIGKMDTKALKGFVKESMDLGNGNFYVKAKDGVSFVVNKGKDGLSKVTCDWLGIYCFKGDTLVTTINGLKEIREIEIGDLVLSKNEETGEINYKEVEEVHRGWSYEVCTLKLGNDTIETTTGHLFMTKNRWWQAAINLEIGEEIQTESGYEKVKEIKVEEIEVPVRIYNLTVKENHTFYVAEIKILAHNGKTAKCITGSNSDNFEVLREVTAEETNKWWKTVMGYDNPPYKPGTIVEEIRLRKDIIFARVYDGEVSGMYGGWVMNAEDIIGLTPKQIQDKFALPALPKYMADVKLPKGTTIRKGIVNPLEGWGKGGGTQYDLIGQRVGEFLNPRDLP